VAAEGNDVATKEVLFQIAEEEKAHLWALGRALGRSSPQVGIRKKK
jgi:hypothetical protein